MLWNLNLIFLWISILFIWNPLVLYVYHNIPPAKVEILTYKGQNLRNTPTAAAGNPQKVRYELDQSNQAPLKKLNKDWWKSKCNDLGYSMRNSNKNTYPFLNTPINDRSKVNTIAFGTPMLVKTSHYNVTSQNMWPLAETSILNFSQMKQDIPFSTS